MTGLIDRLFGAAVSPLEAVSDVIDRFVETPEERAAAAAIRARMAARPAELQAGINRIEARHRSIWVAGWRPGIGWVCGAALAWHYVGADLAAWACALWAPETAPPALTGTEELVTILLGMLGLGGLRTIEKLGGRAR